MLKWFCRIISKSWGKSAGVGRHFICHRYWRGIKPHPTRNEPELIENLGFAVSGKSPLIPPLQKGEEAGMPGFREIFRFE
jgi:hypothetical protein